MTRQIDIMFQIARSAAQRGMDQAASGVEREIPNWTQLAYDWLLKYAKRNERFAGWMIVKTAAQDPNFPQPENEKAWGGVILKAVRNGVLMKDGTTKDPYRHGNPITVWRSTVFGLPVEGEG